MTPRVLSEAELEALGSWPPDVAHSDLVEYFTLDVADLRWVRSHRGAATRLGLAVQLCALRFFGFVPGDLASTPAEVTQRLAERVGVAPIALARYRAEVDGRLRRLHVASVIERAGWRSCGREERKRLADWLLARALEHDDASVLFGQVLEHLRAERIVRPAIDGLLRMVAEARTAADRELYWRLRPSSVPSAARSWTPWSRPTPNCGWRRWCGWTGAPPAPRPRPSRPRSPSSATCGSGEPTASTSRPCRPSGSASWPRWGGDPEPSAKSQRRE